MHAGGAAFDQCGSPCCAVIKHKQGRPIVLEIIRAAIPGTAFAIRTLGGDGLIAKHMDQTVAMQCPDRGERQIVPVFAEI